jgi:hypothetical protein
MPGSNFIAGAFLVLHGLVHMLYFGQSRRYFKLQPALVWPDGSWAFASLVGNEIARHLAAIACVLAALGFVAGGLALWTGLSWWQLMAMGSAVFSTLIYLLFWNGKMQRLSDQGIIAIIINLVIIAMLLIVG